MRRCVILICSFLVGSFVFGATAKSACAEDDLTNIKTEFLPSREEIQQWHVLKDAGGPTFSGSASWASYTDFLETKFREHGMVDILKDPFTYHRWFTSDDRSSGQWSLSVDGEDIPVASYWAYSGSTGPSGVTAPLVYYDKENPPESLEGKIVVFEIPSSSRGSSSRAQSDGYEYATDPETFGENTFDHFYQVNYVTRFGKLGTILKGSNAAGAVVIFRMGPERAAGIYTFPPEKAVIGVPGLYLDRNAGRVLKEAALAGRDATLTLQAKEEIAEPYLLAGFLPGKNYGNENDEIVFLITHTDGPNLSQDDGGLGILGVIQYFSHIPQEDRPRTLLVYLDPQHYKPEQHALDWFEMHPEPTSKIVASIGIEHLGQIEHVERGDDFVRSGLPEITHIFVQDNDFLIAAAVDAVKQNEVPRTMVQSPPRGGQGTWSGLSDVALKRHLPGYGISAHMSAYWSTEARIDKFDSDLCFRQIATAVRLTATLMQADLEEMALPE